MNDEYLCKNNNYVGNILGRYLLNSLHNTLRFSPNFLRDYYDFENISNELFSKS